MIEKAVPDPAIQAAWEGTGSGVLALFGAEAADRSAAFDLCIAEAVNDARLVDVLGGHFHLHQVTDGDLDEVLAQLSGDVGQHLVAVFEFDAEHGPWEDGDDFTFYFYNSGFGHVIGMNDKWLSKGAMRAMALGSVKAERACSGLGVEAKKRRIMSGRER